MSDENERGLWVAAIGLVGTMTAGITRLLTRRQESQVDETKAKTEVEKAEIQAETDQEGIAAGLVLQLQLRITALEANNADLNRRMDSLKRGEVRLRAKLERARLKQERTDLKVADLQQERDHLHLHCAQLERRLQLLEPQLES